MTPRALAPLLLAALAFVTAGCDDALWARYRSDEALYHARVEVRRALQAEPPSAARTERARRALEAVLERWPAATWVPLASVTGPARDVATSSGLAALDLGRLEVQAGRDPDAIERFAAVERDYAPLGGIVVPARVERIDALERSHRFEEALAERAALAQEDPLDGPSGQVALAPVLTAPLELAERLHGLGRDAYAEAMLARADASLARAMARSHGEALDAISDRLARIRAARHDAAGALAALRLAMRAAPAWQAPLYVRAMAARALDAGAPESVFAYARWAARINGSRTIAGTVWFLEGEAWEALGRPDSAEADYDAVLRQWNDPGPIGPDVRYRRATMLERVGQWDQAQAGYYALQARYPTDPLAFESARRMVKWHMEHGEPEQARVAGEEAIHDAGRVLETDLDPAVQRQARALRADLMLTLGRLPEAEEALLDLWRRFPEDSLAEDAGLRAARIAGHRPGGAARADSILAVLRRNAANAVVRRAAGQGAPEDGAPGGAR